MRLTSLGLTWRELVTVTMFLPVLLLPRVATSPLFQWTSLESKGTQESALFQCDQNPDLTARRKVILVPGMRMWGEKRISVHQELGDHFGRLVRELREQTSRRDGIDLRYDSATAGTPGASVVNPNCDFIPYSYSGGPHYWSSDTRQDLGKSSHLLANLVIETRTRYPSASLDLVGYSTGGLVILHWAQHLASPEDLATVQGVLLVATRVHGLKESWVRAVYQRICTCSILGDIHTKSPVMLSLELPEAIPKLVVVNNANDWMVNGKLGDGTSLSAGARCSRLEMPELGSPVQNLSPVALAQVMRNHTVILKDDSAMERVAEYFDLDCPPQGDLLVEQQDQ